MSHWHQLPSSPYAPGTPWQRLAQTIYQSSLDYRGRRSPAQVYVKPMNLKKPNWDRYRQEVEVVLSKRSLPTDCQRDKKIFHTVLLKTASYHIHNGRQRLHEDPVPAEIFDVMTRRYDLHKRETTSLELPRLNYDIQNRIYAHKRKNGEILLRPWTRRQMSPSRGEPLKELMAEQNMRQITKQLHSMEARSHRPSSLPPGSINSSTRQSWEDTLLQARPD